MQTNMTNLGWCLSLNAAERLISNPLLYMGFLASLTDFVCTQKKQRAVKNNYYYCLKEKVAHMSNSLCREDVEVGLCRETTYKSLAKLDTAGFEEFLSDAAHFGTKLVRFMWEFPIGYSLTAKIYSYNNIDCQVFYRSEFDAARRSYQDQCGIRPFTTNWA